jgi:glutamate decarboxylase
MVFLAFLAFLAVLGHPWPCRPSILGCLGIPNPSLLEQYGLVYPGVGWVVWRHAEFLPQELVFNINYLGADQASFTLNFSKGASQVIGQYYQLIRLGKRGYRAIMSNLTRTADYLSDSLKELGFIIMSKKSGEGLPLVAFRLAPNEERNFDEFALAHQ